MMNVIPSVPRLRSLLALLFCLHLASACIQCDRRVRETINEYIKTETDYINIRNNAYEEYKRLAKISKGVIDPTTLYRVTTDFLNAFKTFEENKQSKAFDFLMMMANQGKKNLEKHLKTFVSEGGVCPNKCGLLRRKVKRCELNNGACPNEDYDCSMQLDCGERVVRATEDDQVVLDCFLPWHSLVSGRKEYRYSWAKGTHVPVESDFKRLLVTEESGMVLNQVQLDQWGTYRCELLSGKPPSGTPISQFTFRLHVAPVPAQTLRPPLTLPTLPAPTASKPLLHTVCVVVTTLCLAGSVAVTVFLWVMMRRHARHLAGED